MLTLGCVYLCNFLFHFCRETVRHLCLGKFRVGFKVCCSLHVSARKETQTTKSNMFETKRKLFFLFSEESSPF